jgi:hypothetical protein
MELIFGYVTILWKKEMKPVIAFTSLCIASPITSLSDGLPIVPFFLPRAFEKRGTDIC